MQVCKRCGSIHGVLETGPVKFTRMLNRTGSTMFKTSSNERALRADIYGAMVSRRMLAAPISFKQPAEDLRSK